MAPHDGLITCAQVSAKHVTIVDDAQLQVCVGRLHYARTAALHRKGGREVGGWGGGEGGGGADVLSVSQQGCVAILSSRPV